MNRVMGVLRAIGGWLLRHPVLVAFVVIVPLAIGLLMDAVDTIVAVITGGGASVPPPPTEELTSLGWGWALFHAAIMAFFYWVYRHRPKAPEKEFEKDGEPRLHYLGVDNSGLYNEYSKKIRETLNILIGYFIILWAVEYSPWPISSYWLPRWPLNTVFILIAPLIAGGFLSYYVDWTRRSSRRALYAFYVVATLLLALSLTFGWQEAQNPVAKMQTAAERRALYNKYQPLLDRAAILEECMAVPRSVNPDPAKEALRLRNLARCQRMGVPATVPEIREEFTKVIAKYDEATRELGPENPLADIAVPAASKKLGSGWGWVSGKWNEFFGPMVDGTPMEYQYLYRNPFFWITLVGLIWLIKRLVGLEAIGRGIKTVAGWAFALVIILIILVAAANMNKPGGVIGGFMSPGWAPPATLSSQQASQFTHHLGPITLQRGQSITVTPAPGGWTAGMTTWLVDYPKRRVNHAVTFESLRSGRVVQLGKASGLGLPNNFEEMRFSARDGESTFRVHCNGCTITR